MFDLIPLACDGCFYGIPGIISTVIAVVALVGSIYVLLWSNLGARQAYLVTMVSLAGWMIIMSAIWLFGLPGTPAATGPRGREPVWVPFTTTSEVAREDYADVVGSFPRGEGWIALRENEPLKFPGNIDAQGELENIRGVLQPALARLAEKQGTSGTDPADWAFRVDGIKPATPQDEQRPAATVRFRQEGSNLLVGIQMSATADHPAITVFAYRDKGLVFLPGLIFFVVSILVFAIHLMLLARFERERTEQQAAMEAATA